MSPPPWPGEKEEDGDRERKALLTKLIAVGFATKMVAFCKARVIEYELARGDGVVVGLVSGGHKVLARYCW